MGSKSSKCKLPDEDLEFLMVNTRYVDIHKKKNSKQNCKNVTYRYDETTITEWYKGFRQDCPDGKLNKELFKRIYSKCFPAGQ